MNEQKLRKNLIKLAHSKPELRPDILPLIRKTAEEIPASRKAIDVAVDVVNWKDVKGWGVENKLKDLYFPNATSIKITNASFNANPRECYWDATSRGITFWLAGFYVLQTTMTFKDGSQSSSRTTVPYTFPLDVENFPDLRHFFPRK